MLPHAAIFIYLLDVTILYPDRRKATDIDKKELRLRTDYNCFSVADRKIPDYNLKKIKLQAAEGTLI